MWLTQLLLYYTYNVEGSVAKTAITEICYSHEEGLSASGLQKFRRMLSVRMLLAPQLLFWIIFLHRPHVFYTVSCCRVPAVSICGLFIFILSICHISPLVKIQREDLLLVQLTLQRRYKLKYL